jgi:hypothetical protein
MITEFTEPMQAGFTVEPGIYIPAEGFGIRLGETIRDSRKWRTIQLDAQHSYRSG